MNTSYIKLANNQIDDIDAAIFNGDTFMDTDVVEDFRAFMTRWDKQISEYERYMTKLPKPDPFL